MNFCFVVNDAYVNNLMVLLTSIIKTNPGSHHFFVITSGLNDNNSNKLNEFVTGWNSRIDIVKVDDSVLGDVPLKRNDFNKTPYYKLLLPIVLPETIDRVLYLDVDIVVRASIKKMYNLDFEGKLFAAVPDPLVNSRDPEYLEKLHIDLEKGERYFNSGVILFNLNEMRKKYSLEMSIEYIAQNGDTFKFHDQEVLNGLFYDNYIQLSQKYNFLSVYRGLKDMLGYKLGVHKGVLERVAILHFANQTKPWNRDYIGKYESEFWKYAIESPVYDLIKDNRKNSMILQMKMLIRVVRRKVFG